MATYSSALAVPSALVGLTTLFGMVRGEHHRYSHHNYLKTYFEGEDYFDFNRFIKNINIYSRKYRVISTARLNTLLCLHLQPINVIVSNDPLWNPNLGVGFALICFQCLSYPYIATLLCSWHYNRYTSGMFIPVLSY